MKIKPLNRAKKKRVVGSRAFQFDEDQKRTGRLAQLNKRNKKRRFF